MYSSRAQHEYDTYTRIDDRFVEDAWTELREGRMEASCVSTELTVRWRAVLLLLWRRLVRMRHGVR